MRLVLRASALFALVACGTPAGTASPTASSPAPSTLPTGGAIAEPSASSAGAGPAVPPSAPPARPDTPTIFARIKPDLVACYEHGKKAAPKMADGKLTLNATVDASGATTCVIPDDDTGLTQEVEDCMSARLAAERLGQGPESNLSIPVVVRGGNVELGSGTRELNAFDSIETHRMPDAFDALEAIVPKLQACVREIDRGLGIRSVLVGARVGVNGQTQCAVARSSPVPLPPKAAECTASVVRQTVFPKPSGGPGLILVPLVLVRR